VIVSGTTIPDGNGGTSGFENLRKKIPGSNGALWCGSRRGGKLSKLLYPGTHVMPGGIVAPSTGLYGDDGYRDGPVTVNQKVTPPTRAGTGNSPAINVEAFPG